MEQSAGVFCIGISHGGVFLRAAGVAWPGKEIAGPFPATTYSVLSGFSVSCFVGTLTLQTYDAKKKLTSLSEPAWCNQSQKGHVCFRPFSFCGK